MTLGTESQEFKASFTDPYFLGSLFAVGGDLYHQEVTTFDTYSYKITGGDIRVGRDLSETLRLDALYKLEEVNVFDVTADASQSIKDQEGKKTTSAISTTLTRDTRNDYFAPSRGSRTAFFSRMQEASLGGDNYFVKGMVDTSWYFPHASQYRSQPSGKSGIHRALRGKDRFRFMKNSMSVEPARSAGSNTGWQDRSMRTETPWGLQGCSLFNSELIFPLSREIGLRGAVFVDVGKGFDKVQRDHSHQAGSGNRTPVVLAFRSDQYRYRIQSLSQKRGEVQCDRIRRRQRFLTAEKAKSHMC